MSVVYAIYFSSRPKGTTRTRQWYKRWRLRWWNSHFRGSHKRKSVSRKGGVLSVCLDGVRMTRLRMFICLDYYWKIQVIILYYLKYKFSDSNKIGTPYPIPDYTARILCRIPLLKFKACCLSGFEHARMKSARSRCLSRFPRGWRWWRDGTIPISTMFVCHCLSTNNINSFSRPFFVASLSFLTLRVCVLYLAGCLTASFLVLAERGGKVEESRLQRKLYPVKTALGFCLFACICQWVGLVEISGFFEWL